MLIDYFDRGTMLAGDRPCLVEGTHGTTYSYSEIRTLSLKVANALIDEGFGTGSQGAILAGNDAFAFAATLGLIRSGTAWIPINPRNSAAENARILAKLDCGVLFYLSPFAEAVRRIAESLPEMRLVCIDRADDEVPDLDSWASAFPADEVQLPFDPDAIAAVQPTGGTTGEPKGVVLRHRSFEYCVANLLALAPCEEPPVFVAAAPLTHATGFFAHYILASGGTIVILPSAEPGAFLAALEKWRATHTVVVPTILYALLDHPDLAKRDVGSLKYVFYGGSAAAPHRAREAMRHFGPVMVGVFAQSETCLPVTCLLPADHYVDGQPADDSRLSSCGRPAPFCKLAVVDEEGELLPPNSEGELVVRSSGVMAGYYRDEAATAAAFTPKGWLKTGDVGRIDEDGFCTIVDRKKDMIVSGGFNVFSAEVEAAVIEYPAVADCAVIGIPDDKWGEAVCACVELRPGQQASAEDILDHCRERLARFKAPKTIEFFDPLPKSAVGKVLKRDLREEFWTGRSRRV